MPVIISERELYILDDGTFHPLVVFYLYKCKGERKQRAQTLFKRTNGHYVFTFFEAKTVDMGSGYVCYAEMEDLLYVFNNWEKTTSDGHVYSIRHTIYDVILRCSTPHKDVRKTLEQAWKIFIRRQNIKEVV